MQLLVVELVNLSANVGELGLLSVVLGLRGEGIELVYEWMRRDESRRALRTLEEVVRPEALLGDNVAHHEVLELVDVARCPARRG